MKPPKTERQAAIEIALLDLKRARDLLRWACAAKAADYVACALKSAEGARRHALRGDVS